MDGASPDTARYLNRYFAPVNDTSKPARDLSVAGYRDALAEAEPERRRAGLPGHDPAQHRRHTPGPLGEDQRAAARREVENALADGAVGLSSGLDYLPSRFADIGEIADMAGPLAAAGRPYVYTYAATARTSWPAWTNSWRSDAPPASGFTPAICGARPLH